MMIFISSIGIPQTLYKPPSRRRIDSGTAKSCDESLSLQSVAAWPLESQRDSRNASQLWAPWMVWVSLDRDPLKGLTSRLTRSYGETLTPGSQGWRATLDSHLLRVPCRNVWLWLSPDMWLSEQLYLWPHHRDLLLQPRMEGGTMWSR